MTNEEKQKHIDALKYWCETNEECGVITIPKFVCDNIIEILDNAPTIEERPKGDVLNKIPKDFVYDTETSEFYCYRNKYTGEEIHIIKSPKTYILADEIGQRPKGKWITHSDYPDRLICSNCNHRYDVWFIDNGTNFCPNCGADMRGNEI